MSNRLVAVLPFTLDVEAGYQNNPKDAGNWTGGRPACGLCVGTNRGITPAVLARFEDRDVATITADDMRAISADKATAIYAALFWNPIRGDDLPAGVDRSAFDMQVNAGTNSARCLQRALGFTGDDVDGWIGGATLAAVQDGRKSQVTVQRMTRLSPEAVGALQLVLGLHADGVAGPITTHTLLMFHQIGNRPWANYDAVLCAALHDAQMAHYRSCAGWPEFGKGWTARAQARLAAALKDALGT